MTFWASKNFDLSFTVLDLLRILVVFCPSIDGKWLSFTFGRLGCFSDSFCLIYCSISLFRVFKLKYSSVRKNY